MNLRHQLFCALLVLMCGVPAQPDTALFDLAGPSIGVKVNRAGVSLPISQVPNLQHGDRLWVHPELPHDQAAHYLLIVAFLRGSTNPSPEKWFTRAECWAKKVREEGIFVTVPDEAQQAVIFLAPETSGDFSTLRSAVRGRPGAFVRAVQDLNQASLDRSRLDTYLSAMRQANDADSAKVHAVSLLLARSLNIHLDEDCFKKPVEEQAGCLTQKGGDLVLNDGHSQSIVGALTTGSPSDLVGQLSYTPQAGLGYFSPYVGAIMDMGRILDSLHTAQYQYIPALSLPKNDLLELKLNNPPSFHNPKSVILVALPSVRKEEVPPLRPVEDQTVACAQRTPIVLPVQGAPLVFSTAFAHDLKLQIRTKTGKTVDVPVQARPSAGGFVLDSAALAAAQLEAAPGTTLQGVLHGKWGFDPFTGPAYRLHYSQEVAWTVPVAESSSLSTGSPHSLHLHSPETACLDEVSLSDYKGDPLKVQWKVSQPGDVEITIPAESTKVSGPVKLTLKEAGIRHSAEIPLRIYGETGQFKQFAVIPGDTRGTLRGTNLDQVESVQVRNWRFSRSSSENDPPSGELPLFTKDAPTIDSLHGGGTLAAQVMLKDGRNVTVPVSVEAPRPHVSLLNKEIELGTASQSSPIHLVAQDQLPEDGTVSFSLKSETPATFPRSEKIEIATEDYSFHTFLDIDSGTLTLQDPHTIVGRFDPKSFGSSAFGTLQFRPVDERKEYGDWQPLAKLVRLPSLESLDCPDDPNQTCTLKGKNLFLLEAVAGEPQFSHPATVPEGFIGSALSVPHPVDGHLYVKLRDDPSDVNTADLPPKNLY